MAALGLCAAGCTTVALEKSAGPGDRGTLVLQGPRCEFKLTRDGAEVGRYANGAVVAVEPGTYDVRIRGKRVSSRHVEVGLAAGETATLTVIAARRAAALEALRLLAKALGWLMRALWRAADLFDRDDDDDRPRRKSCKLARRAGGDIIRPGGVSRASGVGW